MKLSNFLVLLDFLSCEAALRIIGGRDARKDEFPYVIRLEIVTKTVIYHQACSGAAITSEWVISAAHCYDEEDLKRTNSTMVARYNSYFPKHIGQISPIIDFFIHPRYSQFDLMKEYDIGLFRSKSIFVSHYAKISAVDYKTLVGLEVHILGFGGTNASEFEKPLQVLKGMFAYCLEEDVAAVTNMCIVRSCDVAATICGGDSGGPIIHSSGIVGVNSRSIDDCNEFTTSLELTPGASASIVAVISIGLDWIQNIITNKTII